MKKYGKVTLIAFFALIGAAFLIVVSIAPQYEMYRQLHLSRPVSVTGEIIKMEKQTVNSGGVQVSSVYPVVQYTTEDGEIRKFRSSVTARQNMQVGDEVDVLFKGGKAVLKVDYLAARNGLLVRLVLSVIGTAAIIAATLYAFFRKPKTKKPEPTWYDIPGIDRE